MRLNVIYHLDSGIMLTNEGFRHESDEIFEVSIKTQDIRQYNSFAIAHFNLPTNHYGRRIKITIDTPRDWTILDSCKKGCDYEIHSANHPVIVCIKNLKNNQKVTLPFHKESADGGLEVDLVLVECGLLSTAAITDMIDSLANTIDLSQRGMFGVDRMQAKTHEMAGTPSLSGLSRLELSLHNLQNTILNICRDTKVRSRQAWRATTPTRALSLINGRATINSPSKSISVADLNALDILLKYTLVPLMDKLQNYTNRTSSRNAHLLSGRLCKFCLIAICHIENIRDIIRSFAVRNDEGPVTICLSGLIESTKVACAEVMISRIYENCFIDPKVGLNVVFEIYCFHLLEEWCDSNNFDRVNDDFHKAVGQHYQRPGLYRNSHTAKFRNKTKWIQMDYSAKISGDGKVGDSPDILIQIGTEGNAPNFIAIVECYLPDQTFGRFDSGNKAGQIKAYQKWLNQVNESSPACTMIILATPWIIGDTGRTGPIYPIYSTGDAEKRETICSQYIVSPSTKGFFASCILQMALENNQNIKSGHQTSEIRPGC